jgi:hypothetical protein
MKKSFRAPNFAGRIVLSLALIGLASGCAAPERRIELARLEARLAGLLELPTLEYVYRDVIYLGTTKSFLFFNTVDKRLLFSLNLRVQAGLDLKQGFALIPASPSALEVRLPPARILSIDADETSIHEYFILEKGEKFGRLEYGEEIERIKPRVEKDALERGMLAEARSAAERLVRGFLGAAGFADVRFARQP